VTPDITQPNESVQYVSDHEGTVQSVLVPIELWRNLLALHNLGEGNSPKEKSAQDPSPSRSLFGAFPALAALEFGHALDAPKRMWQESLDKQLRILREDE
jgi:hypothetical protein